MPIRKFVAGVLTIPVYFPASSKDEAQSLKDVMNKFNSASVSVVHADIHTWCGSSHPLNARRCNFEWFEVVNEDEII